MLPLEHSQFELIVLLLVNLVMMARLQMLKKSSGAEYADQNYRVEN